jgi:hypothetical protein
VRSTTATCLALILGACALPPNATSTDEAANYGLSVAAELRVPGTQQEVAACLRRRENSASYPQGVSPGFSSTRIESGTVRLTQWFYLKHGMTWTTQFVLRAGGDGVTDVQIVLPTELTASQGYRRAALELVGHCQAG